MPIVFVHGVATRKGKNAKAYERRVAARTQLVRRIVAPALGLDPAATVVLHPYWGDDAAQFRWSHAALPPAEEETFGSDENGATAADLVLAETVLDASGEPPPVGQALAWTARQSTWAAIDLLWSATAEVEWATPDDFDRLARFAERAAAWAAQPQSVDMADDTALFGQLVAATEPPADGIERFGGDDGVGLLREGLSRLRTAGPRLASAATAAVLRRSAHESVARFIGDVLAYLRQREEQGADGPIAATVATAVAEARQACSNADPRVVVIAHSMGGNITFDLLSNLRTDLSCDVLITVGSQVGLFAELDLLPAVDLPPDKAAAATHRSPSPPAIGRWLNVFDRCDMFSFAAKGIFSGVEDYAYSTGRGLLKAHSTYFDRPSFFHRLAVRLGERP